MSFSGDGSLWYLCAMPATHRTDEDIVPSCLHLELGWRALIHTVTLPPFMLKILLNLRTLIALQYPHRLHISILTVTQQ